MRGIVGKKLGMTSIFDEASPALALLSDPRPQVKIAAFGALEYRPHWRPGEAELVLKVAQESEEAAVRVAAAYAAAIPAPRRP